MSGQAALLFIVLSLELFLDSSKPAEAREKPSIMHLVRTRPLTAVCASPMPGTGRPSPSTRNRHRGGFSSLGSETEQRSCGPTASRSPGAVFQYWIVLLAASL